MDRSARALRRRAIGVLALSGLMLAASVSVPLAAPAPAVAAASVLLDVSPEDGTTAPGGTVVLYAVIVDGLGQPVLTAHTIRFYFVAGSANGPGGNGNSPDFTCDTGTSGGCSGSYVASNAGERSPAEVQTAERRVSAWRRTVIR